MHRISQLTHATLYLFLGVACAPTPPPSSAPDAQSEVALQGTLGKEELTLSWAPGDQWEQGGCFDLTLTNAGPELEFWALDLVFSSSISSWLYTDSAATWITSDTGAWIGASDGGLDAGGTQTLSYCSEPAAVPAEIADVELKRAPDPDATPTPDPEDVPVTGSLRADSLALLYREDGASKGGTCLEVTVTNLGTTTLEGWSLKVQLDEKTTLTDWWDITPFVSGTQLELYPTAGMNKLASMASAIGHVCMSPLAKPISMSVPDTTLSDSETTSTPMPEADSVAGGIQSDGIALLYRQDGTSSGGTCLEFTITNLSSDTLRSWHLQALLDRRTSLTDWWSITPILNGSYLDLYPASGSTLLDPLESTVGHVCFSPLVEPSSLSVVELEPVSTAGSGG